MSARRFAKRLARAGQVRKLPRFHRFADDLVPGDCRTKLLLANIYEMQAKAAMAAAELKPCAEANGHLMLPPSFKLSELFMRLLARRAYGGWASTALARRGFAMATRANGLATAAR